MKKLFKIKGNAGFFEAEIPFQYSDNLSVIGWLHDSERVAICLTTIPEHFLISIPA